MKLIKNDNKIIKYGSSLIIVASLTMMSSILIAAVVPTAGDLAFDLFDVAINDILDGPIGYIGGISAVLYAGYAFSTSKIAPAIMAVLGGAMVLQTDAIVQTLGATISLLG